MVVLAIVCGQQAISGATSFQITGGKAKAPSDNRLSTLSGFTVDYPRKDWQPLGGAGSSLVVFTHKTRQATVAIETTKIERPLAENEITDQTVTLEVDYWLSRRPLASSLARRLEDYAGARFIVIDFRQPGPQGSERVRMYTLPRGSDWYRVICTTTESTFEKYLDTCHKIALSVTPAPPQ
jgi:hypothetical protein